MLKIGFIGLGNMGFHMSNNLAKSQFEITGFDLNQNIYSELEKINILTSKSIKELSYKKDIIITMLPDGKAVRNVWSEVVNYIDKNTLMVDCSTIDLKTTKEMHQLCNTKNILSLDAPVSGGTIGAENGTLSFMVGGTLEGFNKMLPLFDIMGQKSLLCGDAGAGQATKMCNNLLLAITMTGLGEALKLANSLQLNIGNLFEIISNSTGSCWAVNNYFPVKGIGPNSPADNNFNPGFSSNLMHKDLSLAIDAAQSSDLELKLGEIVLTFYKEMLNNDNGKLDFSAITKSNY